MVNYSSCTPPHRSPVSKPAALPWIIKCQIPSLGSATNTLPTPQVRTGILPNLVEKQSLKEEVATQTEEHLPPFELAPSSTSQFVETCIGDLMFEPRGYSLLPPELFQEIVQHIQELKKCRFPLIIGYYKTVEIGSM